jgi:xylulokinase
MATLLGIDVGTSGCKAIAIDGSGKVLGQASSEYPLSMPEPLWSEQNPEDWWRGVQSCLEQLSAWKPDAIGLTGQMHGSVFLDAEDGVIRPAILWNDQRTAAECEEIEKAVGAARLRQITCNPMLTGFQLPKLVWLRNHEPEAFERVRSVLLPKDYIRFRLSGVKATDVSDASGTGALDVPRRKWSGEVLDCLGLSSGLFPEVLESAEVSGKTANGIPIVAGAGDQAAGAVGTGTVLPGVISVSLGTSGVVFASLEEPEALPSGAAHTFCHANGKWHAMGVMLSCGGALRWFRDSFGNGGYDELAAMASGVEAGAEGLSFLPYLTGERCPYPDPSARAAFVGATLRHGKAHFARSVFEGISFGLADCLQLLLDLGAMAEEIRVTGGGARSPFWVQMLADLFRIPCSTLTFDEGPAFGAAILAGVGTGVWNDVGEACERVVRMAQTYQPGPTDYGEPHRRFRSLYPALTDWFRS